mmetsp:Transcript_1619/g.1556  ORF Transcript_1619/g.1556 Transcript_1619/m.1556 type:complete len:163 (-) Transcript_1619:215-703(-)
MGGTGKLHQVLFDMLQLFILEEAVLVRAQNAIDLFGLSQLLHFPFDVFCDEFDLSGLGQVHLSGLHPFVLQVLLAPYALRGLPFLPIHTMMVFLELVDGILDLLDLLFDLLELIFEAPHPFLLLPTQSDMLHLLEQLFGDLFGNLLPDDVDEVVSVLVLEGR